MAAAGSDADVDADRGEAFTTADVNQLHFTCEPKASSRESSLTFRAATALYALLHISQKTRSSSARERQKNERLRERESARQLAGE